LVPLVIVQYENISIKTEWREYAPELVTYLV